MTPLQFVMAFRWQDRKMKKMECNGCPISLPPLLPTRLRCLCRQMQENAVDRMANGGNSPRLSRGLHPLARGPALQRTWPDEVSSLGPGNMGMPQLQHHQPLGATAWSLPARQHPQQQQQHTHLRRPYSGLRDYSALAGRSCVLRRNCDLSVLRSVAVIQ